MKQNMPLIGITQRVYVDKSTNERRDCLDQQWSLFIKSIGAVPVIVPNNPEVTRDLISNINLSGIVLTGGNDTYALGGDALERDQTEFFLLEWAIEKKVPLMGVCRGMQIIQEYYGIRLVKTPGHVTSSQKISINGKPEVVNSYHNFGCTQSTDQLDIWAVSDDGVIKAIRHNKHAIVGLMWHPERFETFQKRDVALFRKYLRIGEDG